MCGQKEIILVPSFLMCFRFLLAKYLGSEFHLRGKGKEQSNCFLIQYNFLEYVSRTLSCQFKLITSFHVCSVPKKPSSSKLCGSSDSEVTVEFTGLLYFGGVFKYLPFCTLNWRCSLLMTDPKVG